MFARTWGDRAGPVPPTEYWSEVLPAVRRATPTSRSWPRPTGTASGTSSSSGFDHCYDKRLYDRLSHENAGSVRGHLSGDVDYQGHLLRFVENHDEPRAAATFPPAKLRAATVATLTQAGMKLVHEGQMGGARTRLPVFLGRFPDEPVDEGLVAFHHSLLDALDDPGFHEGDWRLAETAGWAGNDGYVNLVAWTWNGDRAGWWSSTCRAPPPPRTSPPAGTTCGAARSAWSTRWPG